MEIKYEKPSLELDDIEIKSRQNSINRVGDQAGYELEMKRVKDNQNNHNNNNLETSGQNNIADQINDNNEIEINKTKFKVPESLKRTYIITTVLAGIGLILFILGFVTEVADQDPGRGLTFWILGLIVMIPGGFYTYQFWRAKRCQDEDQRNYILKEIPEL